MRTATLRGLAAGAGAAAALLAGAVPASAVDGQPTAAYWEAYWAGQGYQAPVCTVSEIPGLDGREGVVDVEVNDQWAPLLADGNEWIGVTLKVADEYDVHAWEGYGTYHYSLEVPAGSPGNITHAIVCQAVAGTGGEAQDGAADQEPAVTEEPALTEEPSDEATGTDGSSETDGSTGTDGATGPAVETDGPATPGGTNLGLVGGAALVLAGAGAAGWAMRRRPSGH